MSEFVKQISERDFDSNLLRLPKQPIHPNLLSKYYQTFEEITVDLSEHIESCVDEKISKYINHLVYSYENLERYMSYGWHETVSDRGYLERWFKSTYKLEPIEFFIGSIPIDNQLEIKYKMDKLKNNPFIDDKLYLYVLAPANNFASTHNVIAIDPIVFVKIKIKEKLYLLPLTQFI